MMFERTGLSGSSVSNENELESGDGRLVGRRRRREV